MIDDREMAPDDFVPAGTSASSHDGYPVRCPHGKKWRKKCKQCRADFRTARYVDAFLLYVKNAPYTAVRLHHILEDAAKSDFGTKFDQYNPRGGKQFLPQGEANR